MIKDMLHQAGRIKEEDNFAIHVLVPTKNHGQLFIHKDLFLVPVKH